MNPSAACFDTITPLVPRSQIEKASGEFVCQRDGISYYRIVEAIGDLPVGYICGMLPNEEDL